MSRLNAPYNFVPLSPNVKLLEKEESEALSHDQPLNGGISGRVRYRIRSHSPVAVGGEHEEPTVNAEGKVHFYRLPDKALAIPGTTVRGMIRNVLEIAAFGKMQLIDDQRFGLRDLAASTKETYRDAMFKHGEIKAGWLTFDRQQSSWVLSPCDYGRISHDRIAALAKASERDFQRPRSSAMVKYQAWHRGRGQQDLKVEVATGQPDGASQLNFIECILPEQRPGEPTRKGTLVFTGQPNTKKRREFVFFESDQRPALIPQGVMRGFLDVHEETAESAEWKYWRKQHFEQRKPIPVFYLASGEDIEALGLAMMFKLASTYSTHEMRGRTTRHAESADDIDRHACTTKLDLAEAIFGFIDDEGKNSLRGRVSFGLARLANPDDTKKIWLGPTALGAPKASYFPTYLRQPTDPNAPDKLKNREGYRTWMSGETELAGWKRYPVHKPGDHGMPELNQANRSNKRVQIAIEAIEGSDGDGGGAVFEGWLRFHNLRPSELGAVIWAMEWGGRPGHRHALGLGKAAGFGQASVVLDEQSLDANDQEGTFDRQRLPDSIDAFRNEMDEWAADTKHEADFPDGWEQSLQVQRLLAMADPKEAEAWPAALRHMQLAPQERRNDFVDAKKQRLVLLPYGGAGLDRRPPLPTVKSSTLSSSGSPIAASTTTPSSNLLWPIGTLVKFAGERGTLEQPLNRGDANALVNFDGEIEEVPAAALTVF